MLTSFFYGSKHNLCNTNVDVHIENYIYNYFVDHLMLFVKLTMILNIHSFVFYLQNEDNI